jgi:hypothetical protein
MQEGMLGSVCTIFEYLGCAVVAAIFRDDYFVVLARVCTVAWTLSMHVLSVKPRCRLVTKLKSSFRDSCGGMQCT